MEQDSNHNHQHSKEQTRSPRLLEAIIKNQNLLLEQKKDEIRKIEDNKVFLLATIDNLTQDVADRDIEIASLKERLEKAEATPEALEAPKEPDPKENAGAPSLGIEEEHETVDG